MIELLWPSSCAGCDRTGAGRLCGACRRAELFRPEVDVESAAGVLALAPYGGPVGRALRRAKLGADRDLLVALARLLAASAEGLAVDAVVPAPSSWRSRWARGFATGAVLAEGVARRLHRPLLHALSVRPGPRQARLDRRRRRENLVGRLRARREVQGHVLLVDDVLTTGSTATVASRELLCAGARCVSVLALCAAEPRGQPS